MLYIPQNFLSISQLVHFFLLYYSSSHSFPCLLSFCFRKSGSYFASFSPIFLWPHTYTQEQSSIHLWFNTVSLMFVLADSRLGFLQLRPCLQQWQFWQLRMRKVGTRMEWSACMRMEYAEFRTSTYCPYWNDPILQNTRKQMWPRIILSCPSLTSMNCRVPIDPKSLSPLPMLANNTAFFRWVLSIAKVSLLCGKSDMLCYQMTDPDRLSVNCYQNV